MISRVKTIFGGVVAIGLAIGTADWKSAYVGGGPGDHHRRGRGAYSEQMAALPAGQLPDVDIAPPPTQPATALEAVPDAPSTQPETPVLPETPVAPGAPPAEPDIVSITDVALAVVDNSTLPMFKVSNTVRLHVDMEGLIYWVTASNRTEMNTQSHLFRNIGSTTNRDRPLLIVSDEFTNWQYVKDTLATADKVGTQEVYLGVADIENKTTLRLLRVMPSPPSDEAREGDFVIRVSEGEGGPAVEVNGEQIETFPIDLALAWGEWRKENPDADVSLSPNCKVVLDAHRFTPTGYVARVVGVLRGLGIEAERFVGSTSYAGRQRK